MGFQNWSTDPDLNGIADPAVPARDGASARTFTALVRGVMAGVAGFALDARALRTTGSANAYVVTTRSGVTDLQDGFALTLRLDRTNTGPATLNVDGTGPKPWFSPDGSEIKVGDLAKDAVVRAVFDATRTAWISEIVSASVLQGAVATANAAAAGVADKLSRTQGGTVTGSLGIGVPAKAGVSYLTADHTQTPGAARLRNLYFGANGWAFLANGPGSFEIQDSATGDVIFYSAGINAAGADAAATPVEMYRIQADGRAPYNWTGRRVHVETFYRIGDGNDWGLAFNRAIASIGAAGGGIIEATRATLYTVASTIVMNQQLVYVKGAALGGLHDIGDLVTGGTKLKWVGADGGTMVRVKPIEGVSAQGLTGWGFDDFALISGDFPYTSAAARGIEIISAQRGTCRIATSEFKEVAVYMSHTVNLGESFCSAYNRISLHARQINTSGIALVLDGDNTHDCYYNQFEQLKIYYNNGDAIDVRVADSNHFYWALCQKAGNGPGRPLVLRGGPIAARTARANRFDYFTQNITSGTIASEGTDTAGVVVPALDNVIEVFDDENTTISLAIGTGSNLRYGLQKMPPGILRTNLVPYGGFRVLTDGSVEMWGSTPSLPANAAATVNLPILLKEAVYNVTASISGNAAGAYGISNKTTSSFQIYPGTAGVWDWRAVGRV